MQEIKFIDRDIRVALEDIRIHCQEISRECMKVWESMEGKLPTFESFCRMYMREMFGVWVRKARWN